MVKKQIIYSFVYSFLSLDSYHGSPQNSDIKHHNPNPRNNKNKFSLT